MASDAVSTVKNINMTGDLTVKKGASVAFDATPNALGEKATISVDGAIINEGTLNVFVSIKTTDVYNEKKGQSILSVLGKEVVWYSKNYYQGGMAQGDILRMVGDYSCMAGNANMTATMSVSGTFDGKGYACTVNSNPSFNHLITSSGSTTVTNLTIDGKNKLTTSEKSTRAFYFTDAESILLNNVNVSGVGYTMNMHGKNAASSRMVVTNSVLKGWTSYNANFAQVTYRDTEFGFGTYFEGGKDNLFNGGIRAYSKTVIENCTFEEGYYLAVEKLSSVATLTLKNCKVGETVLTQNNYQSLLKIEGDASQLVYVTVE